MTPPEHPTLDELADLQAGVLDATEEQHVSLHVSGCAECSHALAALDEVSDLLRSEAAAPATMPSEVAATLDAALARAIQERASGVPSLTQRRTRPEPSRASTRTRSWARLVAAAAVVVVIGATGAAIVNSGSGSDDSASSADAGGAADTAAQGESRSGPGNSNDALEEAPGDANGPAPTDTLAAAHPKLRPDTLPAFAQQLSKDNQTPVSADTHCAALTSTDGSLSAGVSAQVRWRGRPALVLLAPQARRARVLTCEDDPRQLYSTAY